jgi:protein associated with RNAse G/E
VAPGFEPWGWYVNLQEPFRRSGFGLETMDLALDVVVEADRSWRWKDEDELALFVEHDAFDAELAQRLREEGLRVAGNLERDEPPFSEPWHEWRPDPGWRIPELPSGWDRLRR